MGAPVPDRRPRRREGRLPPAAPGRPRPLADRPGARAATVRVRGTGQCGAGFGGRVGVAAHDSWRTPGEKRRIVRRFCATGLTPALIDTFSAPRGGSRPRAWQDRERWRRSAADTSAASAATRRSPGRGSAPAAASGTRSRRSSSPRRPAAAAGGRPRGRAAAAPRSVAAARRRGAAREERLATGIGELDRVLGGGLVPGSLVLLGGSPGIGKSTITAMALGNLAAAGRTRLYVTGEESAAQVRMRAERLGRRRPRRSRRSPRPTSPRCSPRSRPSGPTSASSTRSRRCTRPSCRARPARSPRSARPPTG